MRPFLTLGSALVGAAIAALPVHAEDDPAAANVFNADMSNPDLAAVITSFQEVCLPFIAHTTELTQSLNLQHHVKLLERKGYTFKSRTSEKAEIFSPWKIKDVPIAPGSIRLLFRYERTVQKTFIQKKDIFVPERDKRQTVLLEWNYASQNHPAKSCEIKMTQASLSAETFKADFLSKDTDWRDVQDKIGAWSQCTIDGPDEFEFTAERQDGVFVLSVRRNDFFELKLCGG